MLICPNGHGPKLANYCDECGGKLIKPPDGDAGIPRRRSPPPWFPPRGASAEQAPASVMCPECGRRNPKPDVLDCQGPCGRENLCRQHFNADYAVCDDCAAGLRGKA